jgi:putative hydrolase of the HAD superfamily
MKKKAFIFDLDNTIYPVPSIGNKLFKPVFELFEKDGSHENEMKDIKRDMMRIPFQVVAEKYHFSKQLIDEANKILPELEYKGEIKPFEDYDEIRNLPGEKYIVTTGFYKMQRSKVVAMNLEKDFTEVHIVDPSTSNKTKKDIFKEIIEKKKYTLNEVLVIGDDPGSEIKAANELGVDSVLIDKYNENPPNNATYKINNYKELIELLSKE